MPWPVNKKVIESKWVFKIKSDGKFKARLVARGFQQECNDMYDIYAPVAKLCTFRILLVIACKLKYLFITWMSKAHFYMAIS